ncbi:two-component regulator propeller domain-containing protein [Sphingobacterium sp. LRF_L2]|uniref:two-component regulator propeller domain-containing protein n=1 Tax=Sphingobacterium sp. LRF_L2 TaxID=3369421 RepID=UPI003F607A8F
MLTRGRIYTCIIVALSVLLLTSRPLAIQAQFLQLKFDHITSENGLPHSTIHGIAKDKYGFMWFGTWSGLCRYDGYSIRVYRYDVNNPKSIINNRIHNVLKDVDGNIWISTFDENSLCRYNYETDDFERIPLTEIPQGLKGKINRRDHRLQVNYTYKDAHWSLDNVSTTLVETHIPSNKKKTYTVDPSNPWSINDSYVSDIFLDDNKVLWVGTYSNGINRSYLDATPFRYLYHHPYRHNSLLENTIRSICEDKAGNLWIGTRSKGITRISPTGEYTHFKHHPDDPKSIKSDYIKRIFCDSEGMIWIGHQRGMDRFNPKTNQIEHFEALAIAGTAVFSFVEDAKRNIWIASWNGLLKYDRSRDSLIHFGVENLLPHAHVWYMYLDSKQQLWVGTEGGGIVVLKEKEDGKLVVQKQLKHGTNAQKSLSDNRIYSIFEDNSGNLWIGTGNGLDYYNPKIDSIQHLSQQSDLWPKGTIAGITQDQSGFIWVSHKQGISRIAKKDFSIRTFSKQDGLQNNEFAEGAIYRSSFSNRLYFGGNKGVSFFSPDSIRTNPTPPNIVFTELRILNQAVEVNQNVNGRVVLHQPLYLSPNIELTHEDKSISIEFAALHYANPAGNKYAYMLEGFDKDWIYTDASKRVASYSNLNPGNYVFKVKASNSDGIWTATATTLPITVAPAIWASTGAYVIYFLIFLALLYAFYYYITRYTNLKSKLAYEAILHEKERELHESKVQFFTNISHEIKTPLSLILSPIQQMKTWSKEDTNIREQLQTMENNGNRLLKTVNQLLDIRRFETGHERLHLEKTDINLLVQKVVDSFSQEARQKRIRLATNFRNTISFTEIDADKIEKVLYNLLSNAFKFTPSGGTIKVKLSERDQTLFIDVFDNGTGISTGDLEKIFKPFLQGEATVPGGTGLGLTYSKSLVEMHGGNLTVESRQSTAQFKLTIFRIALPIDFGPASAPADSLPAPSVFMSENEREELLPSEQSPLLPRKCTLLLVEDNDELRSYLAQFFAKEYTVLEAQNGYLGIQLAQEKIPDLIISDVMMPQVDGISFTRQIKANLLTCHIPVILLTARTLVEYEIEGLETGAEDYLVKPFHLPILALKVRNQLLARFRMQEKFKQKISIEPSALTVQSPDEILLQKVITYIEEHISNSDLKIDKVCQSIGLSRAQLYRKMKALTGCSVADLIKELRLKRAQQLLRDKKFNVSEVAYMVGFSDPEYFRKNFKLKFGYSPSEYAKQE